jgi:hypothetical protein
MAHRRFSADAPGASSTESGRLGSAFAAAFDKLHLMDAPAERSSDHRARVVFGYGLIIAATVLLYLLIRSYGERLAAP